MLLLFEKITPNTWSCQLITQDYHLLKLREASIDTNWTDLFMHNVYNKPGSGTLARLRNDFPRRTLALGGFGVNAEGEAEQLLQIADDQM
jgi:hypothetical protein